MLRTEYCLARAERMRMLMLTAADPAAEILYRISSAGALPRFYIS